jgi:hypothetical protein
MPKSDEQQKLEDAALAIKTGTVLESNQPELTRKFTHIQGNIY